jgi:uncharacterized RDD family membrane protein YckC
MQKPTAVVGRRVAAFIIDGLIVTAILAGTWLALTKNVDALNCVGGGIKINGNCRAFTSSGDRTVWYVIVAVVYIGIFVVLQGLTGRTPGKAMLGIRVVNAEGRPPGLFRAFLRTIFWIVDEFPYFIPFLTGFVTALSTERNQRVGDMVASTFVINKNAAAPQGAGPAFVQQPAFGAPPAGAPYQSAPPPPPSGAPVPQGNGGQKADWYPDPQGQARLRYWDGQRWTEHTSA